MKDRMPGRTLGAAALCALLAMGALVGCGSGAELREEMAELRERAEQAEERAEAALQRDSTRQALYPAGQEVAATIPPTVVEGQDDNGCRYRTFANVLAERGTTCDNLEAHVAASADKCVAACDDEARLTEAIAAAKAHCQAWCAAKDCEDFNYRGPNACDVSSCLKGDPNCAPQCPLSDACFIDVAKRFNCNCRLEL